MSIDVRRRVRPVAPLFIGVVALAGLNGCAVNATGLVAARVTDGQGAQVLELYTFGVHLRTWRYDPGISVGVTKRTYIFPSGTAIKPSWQALRVTTPRAAPVAWHVRSFGLDLSGGPPGYGLTIGYRNRAVLASVNGDASLTLALTYRADKPAATRLSFCGSGVFSC